MSLELVIIIILVIIVLLLLVIIIKINNKSQNSESLEIEKINKSLESLVTKTIEQQSIVNSKIGEIGELTKKMTNAMTTNISEMGNMGEVILENILEECGMTKGRDYETQYYGVDNDGNRFRPDVLIFLPQNRNIIIDSKVSIKDWYDYQNSNDELIKNKSMVKFVNSIKNHVNTISKKNYSEIEGINSPDYVFIFMPHEFAFITAQKFDTSLGSFINNKKIVIVGPSTLMMCLKLVENIWRFEKQKNNSQEIAKIAGSMIDQIIKSINLLEDSASIVNKAHNSILDVKKYIKEGKGSLYDKAENMKILGTPTKINLNKND